MPKITLNPGTPQERVLTPKNTQDAFDYLGLTRFQHDIMWVKLEAGVPHMDDEIIAVVTVAEKLGYQEKKDE